ncbi:MAG: transcription elongation factor GreA [Candidatus Abyssobacteria bacterium SURF_17]|uniref:Transcription elongation factor GreA n=1 Tax=Candidatus Abyssobacteria bacterium SURF_17 TaxID=2093361 RepID=A0A419ESM2_9BACT|nr:MAG: transcription elongation factor GreA [Candidatus Abyssubacteria bacterium SURF_17]
MSDFEWLTQEGYDKLRAELEELKNVKRPEMSRILEKARDHGDFRENAEFDSAKHQQMLLENRISHLEQKLSRARIYEPNQAGDGKAYLGCCVKLKDLARGDEFEYTLVTAEEANARAGKISVASPVGKALLGLKAGDIAEIQVPAGKLRYEVLNVSF